MASDPTFRPAAKADAAALAVLVDIAGEGMPAYMWSTLKAPGQSLLEFGRERAQLKADVAHLESQLSSAAANARIEREAQEQLGVVEADASTTTYVSVSSGDR